MIDHFHCGPVYSVHQDMYRHEIIGTVIFTETHWLVIYFVKLEVLFYGGGQGVDGWLYVEGLSWSHLLNGTLACTVGW